MRLKKLDHKFYVVRNTKPEQQMIVLYRRHLRMEFDTP